MSRVASRFWNHKRIAQDRARRNLKALSILVGADDQPTLVSDAAKIAAKHFAPLFADAIFKRPSFLDILMRPR